MKYRETIGLNDKYKFGTELEFNDVYLLDVEKEFHAKTTLPVEYLLHHKSIHNLLFDKWYIDEDSTVTQGEKNTAFGGEISSKILTDTKEEWLELKKICEILKNLGATIGNNCSNHIHIDLSKIKNENYFFEVLSKLIALYEIDIKFFYMGDDYFVRPSSHEYAKDLAFHLLNYINEIDFQSQYALYQFRKWKGITRFTIHDAINLQNYNDKKRIEIRYPNGTLNPKTIQNNINFSLKLIDAINREAFDPVELTRKIEDYKKIYFNRWMENTANHEDFTYLAKTISTSEEDINDFMTQYEHVLSKKFT